MSTDESPHGYHPLPPELAQEATGSDMGTRLMVLWRQLTAVEQEEILAGLDTRTLSVADAMATVLQERGRPSPMDRDRHDPAASGEPGDDDPPASFLAYMQAHFPSGTTIQDPVGAAQGIWRAAMEARRAGF